MWYWIGTYFRGVFDDCWIIRADELQAAIADWQAKGFTVSHSPNPFDTPAGAQNALEVEFEGLA